MNTETPPIVFTFPSTSRDVDFGIKMVWVWYHPAMATNLRLGPEAETALRERARRTGRSQQDVIREALDRHLGLIPASDLEVRLESLIAGPVLRAPRIPYRRVAKRIPLPAGLTSTDLLDRSERL